MPVAIVTGSGGLIGSESVAYFVEAGFDVVGLENDMRSYYFGSAASTAPQTDRLLSAYGGSFRSLAVDIRDFDAVSGVFAHHADALELVIHTAAQPSHDWAASEPLTDFSVNATGTINLLEATRLHRPDATFVFTSTNKVYGDRPNLLPLEELETRLELPVGHEYFDGIPTTMSIDSCLHSLFGASKAAADLVVQEYGRYFDMPTVAFRGGCLTGPNHAGAMLHGFLSYLMRCTVTGDKYTVYGYGGKQVRDNIHSADLVRAFAAFHESPRAGAVYNIGGGTRQQLLDARGNRALRAGRRSRARLGARAGQPRRRPPVVDQRPRSIHERLSRLEARVRPRADPRRDPRSEYRGLDDHRRMKLSIVIPAHNEAGSIGSTLADIAERLDAEGVDYEIVAVDDASSDGTGAAIRAAGETNARIRYHRSHNPPGFGFAVRAGLDVYEGDAAAIVMADGSDSPEDIATYYRVLSEGYDCAFGSRFVRGSRVIDYPKPKLALNRLVNVFIRMLFRHGYNDTTNAFKAYRREAIDTCRPLFSNHFNLTVELPLKAVVRGHSYKIVPISWTNRRAGVSKLKLQEMGSRYLFVVLYMFLERHLAKGDYHRAELESSGTQNDERVLPEAAPPIT